MPEQNEDANETSRPGHVRWWELDLRGWTAIARDTVRDSRVDHVTIVAAGVAFYAVLAIVPISVMAVTMYGLVTDPVEAERQIERLLEVLPADTASIVADQMRPIASSASGVLSIGFAVSAVGLLWTASNATKAIVRGVVIAYDAEESRSRFGGRVASLGLTLAMIAIFTVIVGFVAIIPAWLVATASPLQGRVLRWIVLFAILLAGTMLLYRYAPPRPPPTWVSLVPGAAFAATTWVVVSLGFTFYVENFGSYNETYGVLGGAVILMLWFYLAALSIIVGAEIDAELERYPRRRGNAADAVGP